MEDDSDSMSEGFNEEIFEFPQRMLDQISESSPDGFLLFVINEFGEIELFKRESNDIIESGLRTKAIKILNSLEMVEDDEIAAQIFRIKGMIKDEPPDEEEPEEDFE